MGDDDRIAVVGRLLDRHADEVAQLLAERHDVLADEPAATGERERGRVGAGGEGVERPRDEGAPLLDVRDDLSLDAGLGCCLHHDLLVDEREAEALGDSPGDLSHACPVGAGHADDAAAHAATLPGGLDVRQGASSAPRPACLAVDRGAEPARRVGDLPDADEGDVARGPGRGNAADRGDEPARELEMDRMSSRTSPSHVLRAPGGRHTPTVRSGGAAERTRGG